VDEEVGETWQVFSCSRAKLDRRSLRPSGYADQSVKTCQVFYRRGSKFRTRSRSTFPRPIYRRFSSSISTMLPAG
jgi:hypothetical protein